MSTYDVDVEYRPGPQHGNADGLSRPPLHAGGCEVIACVCERAVDNMTVESDLWDDGEPDYESHPGPGDSPSRDLYDRHRYKKRLENLKS